MATAQNQRDSKRWSGATVDFASRLDRPLDMKPRPGPIVVSLLAHGVLVAWLLLGSAANLPRNPSAYEQLISTHESKLVWYQFKDKLPDVSPKSSADRRPPRADIKLRQSIVSSPKNAPKATQMVWQPLPEIKLPKEVASPNILALKLPPATPAPIERKVFEPPRPVVKSASSQPVPMPAVPDIKPFQQRNAEALRQLAALQPRKIWKTFEAPPPRKIVASSEAPLLPAVPTLIDANGSKTLPQNFAALPKVYKPFTAPAAKAPGANGAGASAAEAPAPPELESGAPFGGTSSNSLNAAVVGLNPSDRLAPLPEGSRAAQFSVGPKLNPDGGTGPDGKGVTVPNLMVRGGGQDTRPALMARNTIARTAVPGFLRPSAADAVRDASKYLTVHDIGHAARVAGAPDPRFDGRQVYTTAIQMPNITSYIGSWLMWYAERNDVPLNAGEITPPLPHRKVDPKYVPTAVEERVEGQVRLACVIQKDGRVDTVSLVKSLDDRLDRSAMDALAKWEFTPAMRNGVPVDVDVIVEIPFRLAPQAGR
ncbi:MAG: energy transducer TonB [Bryobacteraceae bacterium]